MGGCEESKSPKAQISTSCGTEYEEQISRNRAEEYGGSEWGIIDKNGESGSASQNCHGVNSLEINYEKVAAKAINKMKQDLATKEIEQRLRQEIGKQSLNETLCRTIPVPEATESATNGGNSNTLKRVMGKPFGITKIGARIRSIITVGGHEVTRNLCEPSDQTKMHFDVYADYLSGASPQTTSRGHYSQKVAAN